MHKLYCLLGSPRRGGNTDTLAEHVCAGFQASGGEVDKVVLSRLDLQGCTGCGWCQTDHERPCKLQDDMQAVYEGMLAADAVLWASPVYSWAPTVELKKVLDRQFAWGDYQKTRHAKALAGHPVGTVLAYADPDPATNGFYHAYHIMRIVAEASGGEFIGCAHGPASNKGEILENAAVLAKARALGIALHLAASTRS